MPRFLKPIVKAGRLKTASPGPKIGPLSPQQAFNRSGGQAAHNNRRRGLAEARRATLPDWRTLKYGDQRRIARERGVDIGTICRDYQILRLRALDPYLTLQGLNARLDPVESPILPPMKPEDSPKDT